MKKWHVSGIIIAIALIISGVAYPTPEKRLLVSSYAYDNTWMDISGEEYVGGDAYNYQMEASLKAGYMGGVLALKAISIIGGILLFFMTLYSMNSDRYYKSQIHYLQEISSSLQRMNSI
ncbi:MAG: hypothetical protein GX418_07740 [Clostridiales bacterium]|nr:hypothetical protein [Clostridiales bacterium]